MIQIYIFHSSYADAQFQESFYKKILSKYKNSNVVKIYDPISENTFNANNFKRSFVVRGGDVVVHIYPIHWFTATYIYYQYLQEVLAKMEINFRNNALITIGISENGFEVFGGTGDAGNNNLTMYNSGILRLQELIGFNVERPLWLHSNFQEKKTATELANLFIEKIDKRIQGYM